MLLLQVLQVSACVAAICCASYDGSARGGGRSKGKTRTGEIPRSSPGLRAQAIEAQVEDDSNDSDSGSSEDSEDTGTQVIQENEIINDGNGGRTGSSGFTSSGGSFADSFSSGTPLPKGQRLESAVITSHTLETRPFETNNEEPEPQLIEIDAGAPQLEMHFKSTAGRIRVRANHQAAESQGEIEMTESDEEPQLLKHEIRMPIVHEVHEIITPFRKVIHEIQPVVEEVHTIVSEGKGQRRRGGEGKTRGGGGRDRGSSSRRGGGGETTQSFNEGSSSYSGNSDDECEAGGCSAPSRPAAPAAVARGKNYGGGSQPSTGRSKISNGRRGGVGQNTRTNAERRNYGQSIGGECGSGGCGAPSRPAAPAAVARGRGGDYGGAKPTGNQCGSGGCGFIGPAPAPASHRGGSRGEGGHRTNGGKYRS